MLNAAMENADIADFIYRAENWYSTWYAEYMSFDDTMWEIDCRW